MTEIADAEGIGRTLASREANSPECRQLIAEFVGDEWEEMRAVFYRSMRSIEHALSDRREYLTKEGQIMQGGPDHYARLAATKHFRDFLMASRATSKQLEQKDKRNALPELEELLRANKNRRIRRRHTEELEFAALQRDLLYTGKSCLPPSCPNPYASRTSGD